jgi:heme exporter protein D
MNVVMTLGPHAGFIVVAYAIAAAVVAALIGWILIDHRIQKRLLSDLDARGVGRGSDAKPAADTRPA